MDPLFWAKMHGAVVHFPVALSVGAGLLDAIGFALAARPEAREWHRGARLLMVAGALGGAAAVVSGLVMTRGEVLGHDRMRWHHLYAWPAFGLLVGLATWRGLAGVQPSRRALAGYLGCAAVTAGLVAAAAYWGGELLLRG